MAVYRSSPMPASLSVRERSRIAGLIVALIIVLSSLPVFTSLIPYYGGHDLIFHLYRIDGIAQGLRDGQFPVMVQTSQVGGYGYPVSICYGDLFLYFPAALRVLGLSMHASYGLFLLCVNAFCAVSTYVVFRRMFGERRIALLACALWTLSPYRLLIDTYLRAAVGEFVALSFYPVVLYGLYSIVWYGSRGASRLGWMWCALGVAAIVYSHVLSVMLSVLVFLPVLVFELLCKRDLRIVKGVVLAAVAAVGLSLAFAVPFLDYYAHVDMRVSAQDSVFKQTTAYANALQPVQLFEFLPDVALWSIAEPTLNEMPYGAGWSLLAAIPVWAVIALLPSIRATASRDAYRLGMVVAVLIGIFMWMTTVYFPWTFDALPLAGRVLSVLATIQFPWRLVGPISFLLVFLFALGLSFLSRAWTRRAVLPLVVAIGALSCLEVGFGITSFLVHSQQVTEDYASYDATFGIMNAEYLPAGVDAASLMKREPGKVSATEGIEVDQTDKRGTTFSMHVENRGGEGSVTIPLLMYPQYRASTERGDELDLVAGEDGLIQVEIPQGYSGTITVEFCVPTVWRAAEAISVLALAAVVAAAATSRLRRNTERLCR